MITSHASPRLPACLLAGLLLLAAFPPPARPDIIVLKDGKRVEGTVTDRGDAYEVRTKYGMLSIRKEEVSRVVRLDALLAEAEAFLGSGKEILEEALKPDAKPEESKAKRASAEETFRRGLDILKDARALCPPEAAPDLDRKIGEATQAIARCRGNSGPDTLDPVAPPKTAAGPAPGSKPAEKSPPDPAVKPAAPPEPGTKSPVKAPAPTGPVLAEAEKEIRSIFKDDSPRKTGAEQVALARKMLKAGEETKDNAALQFAALREAQDLAAAAGDLGTALAAIARLDERFEVDVPELKASAVKAAARTRDPEDAERVFAAGMDVMGQLGREEAYDAALKLASPLEDLARRLRNPDHVKTVQDLARDLRAQQIDWNRVRPHFAKLKDNPEDAEACLAAGRYLAAIKGDWTAALPLLAKGSHAGLQSAAAKDLAKPADAAALAELGDLWAAQADKETGACKAAWLERARSHYEQALPKLAGLAKARVEKRIESLSAAPGSATGVNLLALVVPARHVVAGTWKADGRALTSDAGACSRIMLPYEVPDEYDFRVDFTRLSGESTVALILTKGGRDFVVETGWPTGQTGFAYVDGKHIDANPTGTKCPVTNGRRTSYVVQVRNAGLKLFVDGRPVIAFRTDYKNVTPHASWALPDKKCLGIGSYASPTTFHAAELIEVSGRGRPLK
jgi:hypothetical protein